MKDLVRLAQQGDLAATNQLLEMFKDRVRSAARKSHIVGGCDLEDVTQEGLIGLIGAIKTYDEQKCQDFLPYALTCVNRQIINFGKKNNTAKSLLITRALPLDELDTVASGQSTESIVMRKETNLWLKTVMDENLSKLEAQVVICYLNGDKYTAIAKQLGLSSKAVDNALSRARVKLAKIWER